MNNYCDKNNKFHRFFMILCCAIPVLVIGVLYFAKVQGTPWGSILSFSAILLCPLMHLIVMPLMMGRKNKGASENKQGCH